MLCIESILLYAKRNRWELIGQSKQGQALLALGLAQALFSLQELSKKDLSLALERREALLRLVDPSLLGNFRWFAFNIDQIPNVNKMSSTLRTLFLEEPIN